jgi:hypothetical protein
VVEADPGPALAKAVDHGGGELVARKIADCRCDLRAAEVDAEYDWGIAHARPDYGVS